MEIVVLDGLESLSIARLHLHHCHHLLGSFEPGHCMPPPLLSLIVLHHYAQSVRTLYSMFSVCFIWRSFLYLSALLSILAWKYCPSLSFEKRTYLPMAWSGSSLTNFSPLPECSPIPQNRSTGCHKSARTSGYCLQNSTGWSNQHPGCNYTWNQYQGTRMQTVLHSLK